MFIVNNIDINIIQYYNEFEELKILTVCKLNIRLAYCKI